MPNFLQILPRLLVVLALMLAAGQVGAARLDADAEAVDINQADAVELATRLNGVGRVRSAAIVEYRQTQGPFVHPDELAQVKGIGPKTLEKNRQRIRIGPPADSAQQ